MRRSFGEFDQLVGEILAKSFLSSAPENWINRVLETAMLVQLPAGSIAYEPYQPGKIALVLSGMAKASLCSREGRRLTVVYFRAGDVVGLPTIVGGPLPLTVEVIQDGQALLLDPNIILAMAKECASVGFSLAEDVGNEFCEAVISLGEDILGSVPERTARHLLELAKPGNDGENPLVKATHQQIAEAAGTVREVMTRTLRQFQSDGLIALHPRSIELLDVAALRRLSTVDSLGS